MATDNSRLKAAREALGLTQVELVRLVHEDGGPRVDQSVMSRVETGRERPSRNLRESIGRVLGLDPADVFPVETARDRERRSREFQARVAKRRRALLDELAKLDEVAAG